MRHLTILIVLAVLSSIAIAQPPTGHPRLFFGPQDTSALISLINVQGSDAQELFQEVEEQSNYYMTNYLWDHPDPHGKYAFHQNLLSLAFRYLMTHNTAFSDRAKEMIFRTDPIFRQQGIIWDYYPGGFGLRTKVATLAIMYDWLYEQLSSSERSAIQDTIIQDLAFPGDDGIREYFNQETIDILRHEFQPELTLLMGAMSIYGENPNYPTSLGDQDIETAIHFMFTRELSHTNRIWSPEDGVHGDGVSYSFWNLYNQLAILEAWSHWDDFNHFEDPGIEDRFSKVADWYAYEVLPNQQTWPCMLNALNDSYSWHYSAMGLLLHLSAKYPEKAGLMRWVFDNTIQDIDNLMYNPSDFNLQQWTQGNSLCYILPIIAGYTHVDAVEPSSILPSSKHFRWAGLVQIRSEEEWGEENDFQFAFTSQPIIHPFYGQYSHHHDQADKNHFTLSAYGDLYLRDYGYNNGASTAHNVVLVDGRGQPYACSRQGTIVAHQRSQQFDFIHGDATSAYNRVHWFEGGTPVVYTRLNPGPLDPSVFNSFDVDTAQRYVTFCRESDDIPAYFIIADDIEKSNQEAGIFTWRFQTGRPRTGTNPYRLEGTDQNYLDMFFGAASTFECTDTELEPYEPWEGAIDYQDFPDEILTICDNPSPVNLTTTSAVVNPYFHVALVPHKSGDIEVSGYDYYEITNGSIVQLTWPNSFVDYSIFKHEDTQLATGNEFETDAKISRVRVNGSGVATSFLMAEGTSLAYTTYGQVLVDLFGTTGTVMKSGSVVDINATGVSYFQVYAPNATTVRLNSVSVPFVQVGNHVESSTITVNRTWSGLITTSYNITVNDGVTLTLGAGARMFFDEATSLVSYGTIVAVGGDAPDDITLSSLSPTGTWSGIVISAGEDDGDPASVFEYVTIDRVSTTGGAALSVIEVDGVIIRNCTISNNLGSGTNALFLSSAGSPVIGQNTLNNNPGSGVYFSNTNGVFYGNVAKYNSYAGVRCSDYSSPTFALSSFPAYQGNNTIKGSSYGVYASTYCYPLVGLTTKPWFGYNDIDSTSTARIFARVSSSVAAQRNWWGSASPNPSWFVVDGTSTIDWTQYLTSDPTPGMRPGEIPKGTGEELTLLDDPTRIREAIELRAAGRREEAKALLREVFSEDPTSAEATQAGVILLHLYRDIPDRDIADFVKTGWERHRRTDPLFSLIVAKVLAQEGRVAEAASLYNTVASGNRNSQYEKSALLDLFYVYLANPNFLASAQSVLAELQTRYANDEDVMQAAWLCGLGRGSVSHSSGPLARIAAPEEVPHVFALHQNYPNPFNPTTALSFDLPEPSTVSLVVYDVLGRKIAELAAGPYGAGYHTATWNASDQASGIYFARFTATSVEGKPIYTKVNKLVLMK